MSAIFCDKTVHCYYQEKKSPDFSDKTFRNLLNVIVEAGAEGKSFPVKLVYVRNRKKRKEYLVLAFMDTALIEDEIIQLYGRRWSTEVYFKMCKQYLQLAKFQGLSYVSIVVHTIVVPKMASQQGEYVK